MDHPILPSLSGLHTYYQLPHIKILSALQCVVSFSHCIGNCWQGVCMCGERLRQSGKQRSRAEKDIKEYPTAFFSFLDNITKWNNSKIKQKLSLTQFLPPLPKGSLVSDTGNLMKTSHLRLSSQLSLCTELHKRGESGHTLIVWLWQNPSQPATHAQVCIGARWMVGRQCIGIRLGDNLTQSFAMSPQWDRGLAQNEEHPVSQDPRAQTDRNGWLWSFLLVSPWGAS